MSVSDVCQKCGTPTNGEEALVEGQIWCHPCADGAAEPNLRQRGIDEAYRRYDGSAAQRLAFNCGVKWCLEQVPTTGTADLGGALRKLIHAVKTYQFTSADTPEKSMAAADLDDALDEARVVILEQRTA